MNKTILNIEIKNIHNYICFTTIDDKKCFIENGIVGDIVDIEIYRETSKYFFAKITKFITKSSYRTDPVCKYYNICGGCDMQHLNIDYYYNLKKLNIYDTIIRAKFDIDIDAIGTFKIKQNTRRRINLKYFQGKYGFFKRNSNEFVKIDECLLLTVNINTIIKNLQNIKLANLNSVDITELDNGIALNFIFNIQPNIKDVKNLIFSDENIILITYTVNNDGVFIPVYKKENPKLNLDNLSIDLPEHCFLQATKESQDYMINTIKNECFGAKNILDLYCGIGTYSFPLAKNHKVIGYEGDLAMVNSIRKNINNNSLSLNVHQKDLFNQPLLTADLNKFDVVIINPPRNGAENQIKQISKSKVNKIIYVSCNPDSLQNDLEFLNQKYKIKKIYLVDQFFMSSHSENIIVLEK